MTQSAPKFTCGIVCAALNYFAPVSPLLIVAVLFIIADFGFGLWASYRLGIGIKSLKMWRTIYKLICAVTLIALCYAVDKHIADFGLARLAAGLICGFELWSILENMAKITEHPMFLWIRKIMNDRVSRQTGVNFNPDNKEDN